MVVNALKFHGLTICLSRPAYAEKLEAKLVQPRWLFPASEARDFCRIALADLKHCLDI